MSEVEIKRAFNDCPPDVIEVRRNEDGTLDEIVADGCSVHLEQMSDRTWWLSIRKNGYRQVVWLTGWAKGTIKTISEIDEWPETKE